MIIYNMVSVLHIFLCSGLSLSYNEFCRLQISCSYVWICVLFGHHQVIVLESHALVYLSTFDLGGNFVLFECWCLPLISNSMGHSRPFGCSHFRFFFAEISLVFVCNFRYIVQNTRVLYTLYDCLILQSYMMYVHHLSWLSLEFLNIHLKTCI